MLITALFILFCFKLLLSKNLIIILLVLELLGSLTLFAVALGSGMAATPVIDFLLILVIAVGEACLGLMVVTKVRRGLGHLLPRP